MNTEAQPAYLATPEASQAHAVMQRAAQDALSGIVGDAVTVTVNARRAFGEAGDLEADHDLLVELQFERPAGRQHSVAILAGGAALLRLFSLTQPDDEAGGVGAESLLSLGDIASTFLDTFAVELQWLQPMPRAWLANMEPFAPATDGGAVALPPAVLSDTPLYLADLSIGRGDLDPCPVSLIFGEGAEQALLGLDQAAAPDGEEALDFAPAPAGSAPDRAQTATPAGEAPTPVQPVQFKPLGGEHSVGRTNSIDLIKDVPLHVTVELGRASLTVREILALNVGSVVELDRLAGEPVDVLVNDRLIARGEVVIVDESFGVRLTQVFRESSRRSAS